MTQAELNTHECIKFFLPRISVALEEIAKVAKFEMEEKKLAKETAKEISRVNNLTLEEALKELRGEK